MPRRRRGGRALTFARDRHRAHHQRQKPPRPLRRSDRRRARLALDAIEAVGLTCRAARQLSELGLMMTVPAKVPRRRVVIHRDRRPGARSNPLVLVAADLRGRFGNLPVGGAQAIAALAYGTQTIRPVAKIDRPGNAFVAAAKRQVWHRRHRT